MPERVGSQTVDRAMALLKLVADAPRGGVRLAELAGDSGLDRATAFRLLTSLAVSGLVEQDGASKRYSLGLAFFAMAAAASNRVDLSGIARGALQALCQETGDTAALCLRSGMTLVCMDLQTGSFPIKALPMDVGSHRPLGAGAAGVALLAGLPDFEVERALGRGARRTADATTQEVAAIRIAIASCRRLGYAMSPEPPPGRITGLAVALVNRLGRPQGALALYGIAERFEGVRPRELATRVAARARAVDEAMWRLPDDARHRSQWLARRPVA